MPGPWDVFTPYTPLHAAAVLVCALAIVLLIAVARRLRGTDAELSLRRAFAWSCLVYWVFYNAWWHVRGIDWFNGLPLHICDLGGLIGPFALLTGNRWLRATLYFWTFALTAQAFIQPALVAGPSTSVFWFFFAAHAIVLACALYDLMAINAWLGANYAYIGDPPPPHKIPPFIDALGPWPLRAVLVLALAALSFPLLVLPWKIAATRRKVRA